MSRRISASLLGIVFGFLGAKMLFLGWFTLLPWGIVAFILGYLSDSQTDAAQKCALYGVVLGFTFILIGYRGEDTNLLVRAMLAVIVGFFCILSVVPLGVFGHFLKDMRNKN
jgi:uncharacterized membrane protein